jgi:hypothetical protein
MNLLAENAVAIWAIGAVMLTMALIVYFQVRTTAALVGVVAVMLLTAALLVTEWLLVSPREAVLQTLYDVAASVESNDVPGTLAYITPTAGQIRTDVEQLMPLVDIEKANVVSAPQVDLDESPDPTKATAKFRVFVDGTVRRGGHRAAVYEDVTITFVRQDGRWLVDEYTTPRNWRRELGR